eukprot:Gb_03290 [translate_table: standard]
MEENLVLWANQPVATSLHSQTATKAEKHPFPMDISVEEDHNAASKQIVGNPE